MRSLLFAAALSFEIEMVLGRRSFMGILNKNYLSIFGFLLISFFVSANIAVAEGTWFNWEPFVAKTELELNSPASMIFVKNLSVKDLMEINDSSDHLLDFSKNEDLPNKEKNKSIWSRMKVTVSQTQSFMMANDDSLTPGDKDKLSRVMKALPSLMSDPTPDAAINTLKMIEPRVNLFVEF
jgi:hypothetical protein